MAYHVHESAYRREADLIKQLGCSQEQFRRRLLLKEFGTSYAHISGEYLLPGEGVSNADFSMVVDFLIAEKHAGADDGLPSSEDHGGKLGEPVELYFKATSKAPGAAAAYGWLLGKTLFFGPKAPSSGSVNAALRTT